MNSEPTRPKVLLAWSTGKDSAWALHVLRQAGDVEVEGLLTTFNATHDRVAMHATRHVIAAMQAQRTGLPLHAVPLPWPCSNADYEAAMAEAFNAAKVRGVTHVAFGDLFLQDIRDYRERQLAPFGLQAVFPLWHTSTEALARRMIDAGLVAYTTCIDPTHLPPGFVGRRFDTDFLAELPPGVDPCGEHGEFHTCVLDGPMFSAPIQARVGDIVRRDHFLFADLLPP